VPLERRFHVGGNPKESRSQGSSSLREIALPVEWKKAIMFGEKPSPPKTTIPGIGHAAMSWIVAGTFSSALPPPPG